SSRRRHTICYRDWSSDVCSSDLLSDAANPERAAHAIASAGQELVRPQDGVSLLFRPPFDKTPLDPGYIKGYPPGIRENGGQYTRSEERRVGKEWRTGGRRTNGKE